MTVLGEFSSGKSTFINALLREKLLAMKQRETTATITKLQYGKKRKLTVHFKDMTTKSFDIIDNVRSMDEYLVENDNNEVLDTIQYATVELENPLLQHLDLADTPGFNSNYNRHTEITKDFIRYSDLVMWLFDARKMGKASEFKVISEHCKYYKPIGIVNWINKLPLKDGESPENHLKSKLNQYEANFEKFFFVSAYDGLNAVDGEYKRSGMQDVVDYFLHIVIPECNTRKNNAIIQRLRIIGAAIVKVQKALVKQNSSISNTVEKFDKNVQQFEALQKKYEIVTANWNNDVSKTVIFMIDHFDRYFIDNEIPPAIEKRQREFSTGNSDLEATSRSLESSLRAIEKGRTHLVNELGVHNELVADYYNNHKTKAFFEDLLDISWSKEKIAINNSASNYTNHENSFNSRVNSHNRLVERYNSDYEQYSDSLVNFINNTVLLSRDKQYEKINELAQQLEIEWVDIQKLNSETKKIAGQLKIIDKDISPQFAELLRIVATDKSVSFENMDLSSILNQIDAESTQKHSLDWSHIYSRSKIEKSITNKACATKTEGPDMAETEKHVAQTIE